MTALIIIAAVIAFILLMPLRAEFRLKYNDNGLEYSFLFKAFGIRLRRPNVRKKKDVSDEKQEDTDEKKEQSTPLKTVLFICNNIDGIKTAVGRIANYSAKHFIKIKRLMFHSVIGFDDAMDTALIYGCSAAVIYNAAAAAQRKLRLVKHDIKVEPDFNNPHISADIEVIITTNIFHTVVMFIIAAKHGYPLLGKYKEMFSGADAEEGD